jgi:c-di-GMP-binding flagellar brake protein YcgR
LEEYLLTKEEKETKPRYGTVNFEKRNYPRFNIDLPVEYSRTNLFIKHGRVINASEGGLLLYLPEQMEIGQPLRLKLFLTSGFELNAIETLVEVVWMDIHLGKDWGDYRTGVRFVEISLEDRGKLKNFLRSLSG